MAFFVFHNAVHIWQGLRRLAAVKFEATRLLAAKPYDKAFRYIFSGGKSSLTNHGYEPRGKLSSRNPALRGPGSNIPSKKGGELYPPLLAGLFA